MLLNLVIKKRSFDQKDSLILWHYNIVKDDYIQHSASRLKKQKKVEALKKLLLELKYNLQTEKQLATERAEKVTVEDKRWQKSPLQIMS